MKSISQQIFQYGFVLAIVVIVVLLVDNFKNKNVIEQLKINNLELLNKLEQSQNESIERKREPDKAAFGANKPANTIALYRWDIEEMKRKGLKDPVKDIITDLRQHRELIPYEGTLGGTMNFYSEDQIWILTKKWVLAYFEDGHNGGYLLLEYQVTKNGKIKWNGVASYIA